MLHAVQRSWPAVLVLSLLLGGSATAQLTDEDAVSSVKGSLQQWHPVTLTFDGPPTSENDEPNPFRFYRLTVRFSHEASGDTYEVPGYYAADGNADETGASEGRKWRVHFLPPRTGRWHFDASFRRGTDVALSLNPEAGEPTAFDGTAGSFDVAASDKSGRDFRGKGLLRYVGQRYLQFDDGDFFIKGGADSPENFLAYADFDNTYNNSGEDYVKTYKSHAADWQPGDPTWQDGKGKGIIGALNYLSSRGMNSVYFLTMNVAGDGDDVWPWTAPDRPFRYDVSKLAQWNRVFDHMDRRGLLMHVLTQETENDTYLDDGALGPQRKLYYRELVARFGHHPALQWNLGEENTNTDRQRKAFARHMRRLDPYDHPIVVHTYPGDKEDVFAPLLGFPHLEGPSLQMGNFHDTHEETKKWITRSRASGHPWYVSLDEIGPADTGVPPDGADDALQDAIRKEALWAHLMAGGAGVEWYFGYQFEEDDLAAEDWRSREQMWDYTRHALQFFHRHLPFTEMTSLDELTPAEDYVLAQPGAVYAVYLPQGGTTTLELEEGTYEVRWYNPRSGGTLRRGSVATVRGAGHASLGQPPADAESDWVALIRIAE